MADVEVPLPVTETNSSGNATVFTFEEQATASIALYSMSLLCIVIGGIRSASYVKTLVTKKKFIESSITTSEAKKFPLSASLVLFGLYIFFKPAHERLNWVVAVAQKIHVSEHLVEKLNTTITSFMAKDPDQKTSFLSRMMEKLPDKLQEYAQKGIDYIPEIGKNEILMLLTFLICFEGLAALATLLKPIFSAILRRLLNNRSYLLSMKKSLKEMEEGDIEDATNKETEYLFKIEIDRFDIFCLLFCSPVLISHLIQRHWITNNIIGISFSIYGIERLHLSSFKAGTLLLAGLFIYDIFWVFATDVMTSVAKGINAPILLQFPQDIYRNGFIEANKYSMLGLGDIVIPGIFIALLRRFDQRVSEAADSKKTSKKPRFFFFITTVAYAFGLFATMLVMHHFKAAQPALLYLVPCCLLVPLATAACTGELTTLWNYNEDHLLEENHKKKVSASKKNN